MSDYLQNLVGIAQGQEARVRPIIRSSYETPRGGIPPSDTNEKTVERPSATTSPREPSPTQTAPTPSAQNHRAPEPPSAERGHDESKENALLLPSRTNLASQSTFVPPPHRPVAPLDQIAPTLLPPSRVTLPPRSAAPAPLDRESLSSPRSETTARAPSPAGFQPRLVELPISSVDQAAPGRSENLPRPPDIHVTIGRVEVRAAAPAPAKAAPRVKSSAPTLSLEDYLKTREGRRL